MSLISIVGHIFHVETTVKLSFFHGSELVLARLRNQLSTPDHSLPPTQSTSHIDTPVNKHGWRMHENYIYSVYSQIMNFNRVFHYKPSILERFRIFGNTRTKLYLFVSPIKMRISMQAYVSWMSFEFSISKSQ